MARPPKKPTYAEANTIITAAIAALRTAYIAANSADEKDRITSVTWVLKDESDAIVSAGLADDSGVFQAQSEYFKGAKAQIDAFQKQVDQVIHYVHIAGQVADALAKLLMLF